MPDMTYGTDAQADALPAMYGPYGDQCADTDGLAAQRDALLAEIAGLKAERDALPPAAVRFEVKFSDAEIERMVRDVAARLGIPMPVAAAREFPARALRFGAQDVGLRCLVF